MSVLIKGMELPKSCKECGHALAKKYCMFLREYSIKFQRELLKEIPYERYAIERLPDCPLVAVPTPHGRLIDCERATFPTAFRYNTNDYAKGWNACIKAVQTAPTIIEAEVSEE